MLNFVGELSAPHFIVVGLALIVVIIVALTLHEFAHAFVAYKNGDDTAKVMGRVSLNPLVHIDPIGFICCTLFGFGWAKPVPINPIKFRQYRRGMFLTSIAGVTVNLILAFFSCALYLIMVKHLVVNNYGALFLLYLTYFSYIINVSLFVFNLLPIYPLDGFNALDSFTKHGNRVVEFLRRYGWLILLMVLILGDGILVKLIHFIALPIELFWSLII